MEREPASLILTQSWLCSLLSLTGQPGSARARVERDGEGLLTAVGCGRSRRVAPLAPDPGFAGAVDAHGVTADLREQKHARW